jgi:uncharacterized delta-60 repeat protein
MFFGKLSTGLLTLASALCSVACWATVGQPGTLDPTFGGSGKIVDAQIGMSFNKARAVLVQPDGKIVVAGSCSNTAKFDFCAIRYQANGAPDTSFGGGGYQLTPVTSGADELRSIALQADGKLLLAGECGTPATLCVIRYTASGVLDSTFAVNGKFLGSLTIHSAPKILVQPDGKILVVSRYLDPTSFDLYVTRLTATGALDTSFNSTGVLLSEGLRGAVEAIALDANGRVLLAATCFFNGSFNQLCVRRLLPDGAIDATFGASGTVQISLAGVGALNTSMALQPDGGIVIAGACRDNAPFSNTPPQFCAARLKSNGDLDPTFATGGKLVTSDADFTYRGFVTLQSDGNLLAAGTCKPSSGEDRFCAVRFHSDGTLDTSFALGKASVDVAPGMVSQLVEAMALQVDGKVVVVGTCRAIISTAFCLMRLDGGPFGAQHCTLDIDGDNKVLATTDALIHTRIARGIRGSAVVAGIAFTPGAMRTTWPQIRSYLVSQCGMSLTM